ncbi:MAG: alcohol dehydrogenase [Frankiales bacterium]|nr:alcohol dehydrogenase [Frankiales bacterium]
MTTYLTLEDLLALVGDLGVGPVRDLGLLDSAAHRPTTSLYGHEAYPTLDSKAAVLLDSLVGNHALVDGNERLGWLAVVVFYGLNGIDLDAPDDDAFDLVVGVASGQIGAEGAAERLGRWRARRSGRR